MFLLAAAWYAVEGVAWLLAVVARFLIRRPVLLLVIPAVAFLGWLLAPILSDLGDTSTLVWLGAIGVFGLLTAVLVVGRAMLDDRRYERGIRTREAAEAAAEAAAARAATARPPVPAGDRWWEEGR